MGPNFGQINYVAVLVSAIANFAIGFAWYSRSLFGGAWTRARNINMNDPAAKEQWKKGMAQTLSLTFLANLVTALVLAVFVYRVNPLGVIGGLKLAAVAWLGFVGTVQLTGNLYGSRNKTLYFIDTGYQLVAYLAMGAILGGWR